MNIDHILSVFNRHDVRYLLIGGVNFLLRHKPVLTYDVDFWIEDTVENRTSCERALSELNAEWGQTDEDWRPAAEHEPGWIGRQAVYCLTSPSGAIDIFLSVKGLDDWTKCNDRAVSGKTAADAAYRGLCDADMLAAQKALDVKNQKLDRIRVLEAGKDAQNAE